MNWVDKRKELGDRSEEIVYNYIKDNMNPKEIERIPIEESEKGYDIIVNSSKYYEVKTLGAYNTIYLTRNELQKATYYKEKYSIIIVDYNKKVLYVIKNPIEKLSLPVKELINSQYSNDYCRLFTANIKLYLKRLDEISHVVPILIW